MSVPENASPAIWYISHSHWPFVPVLTRSRAGGSIGLFVGLECEHSRKNCVRTFALTALLGCLGGLMGALFSGIALGFVAMMAAWMNWRRSLSLITFWLPIAITLLGSVKN
jgi:hypothetical protein